MCLEDFIVFDKWHAFKLKATQAIARHSPGINEAHHRSIHGALITAIEVFVLKTVLGYLCPGMCGWVFSLHSTGKGFQQHDSSWCQPCFQCPEGRMAAIQDLPCYVTNPSLPPSWTILVF